MKKHKVLWLSIAGIILVPALIVGGYTAYLALAPTKTEFQGTAHANKVLSKSSLNKDQFNELVQKHLANTNYAVKLSGNNVVASGTAMDGNVSAKLTMTPTVTKDGNVIMSVKKAVVNGTTVPGQVALGYLKKITTLPAGVTVQPDKSQIALDVNRLTDDGTSAYKVDQINVAKGIFNFSEVASDAQ